MSACVDLSLGYSQRWAQIHQHLFKIKYKILCGIKKKYKYKILCGKMYLNTNTVFCILKIHKILLKLAIQRSNNIMACLHQER